ncbi:glycosyltransferase (plasmid) [Cetobacterium somerae ATCC BAA-474]
MKKIIFIVNDITITGGLERVVSNLSNIFVEKGQCVKIISLFKNSDKLTYKLNPEIEIEYLFYPKGIKSRYMRGVIKFIKYLNIIKKLYLEKESIIIGTDYYINIIISLLDKNTVGMEHVIYESTPKKIRKIKLKRYKKLKKLVVVNRHDYTAYEKESICINYIPNPNSFANFKEEVKKEAEKKQILSIGRLENGKGFENLIDICSEVFKIKKEWELHIYGKGSLETKLKELIKLKKMENNIKLKGINRNLEKVYPNYKFLLSASEMESFSLTLIEAQTFGLPIISYDCPWGPRDIINNTKDGYLVECFNKQEFKNKIINLIENQNKLKEMSLESINNSKMFNNENIYNYWKKLFEELD